VRDDWYWVDSQGRAIQIHQRDLLAGLSARSIPHSALVWHPGWKYWMTADRVAELASALRGLGRVAHAPVLDARMAEPPAVPGRSQPSDLIGGRSNTPQALPTQGRPLLRRRATPTIADVEKVSSASVTGGTLRPPGAVPPPPPAVPPGFSVGEGNGDELDSAELRSEPFTRPIVAELPSAPTRSQTPVPRASFSKTLSYGLPEVSSTAPPQPQSSSVPKKSSEMPKEETPDPTTPHTDELAADDESLKLPMRRRTGLFIVLGAAFVAAFIGGFAIPRVSKPSSKTATATTKPSTTPSRSTRAQPSSPPGCQLLRAAERVAPNIVVGVTPNVATLSEPNSIAVGFADTPTSALGMKLDISTLTVSWPLHERRSSRIESVVPALSGTTLGFLIADSDSGLGQPRPVDASADFILGGSPSGLARKRGTGEPELVWPASGNLPTTEPRIATMPTRGHAITFRQGGQNGQILFGWLTETGEARLGPWPVATNSWLLGTPSVAANTTQVVVTFALRESGDLPWSLGIARAEPDQPILPAEQFPVPEGGPGGDCIAPTITAIGERAWLLLWFEGKAGERQVRAQLLARDLHPLGTALTLSPPGTNAGQGTLWSNAERAVPLFIVGTGASAELWAASLVCSS
jgi:hypothetical protein